MPEGDTVVVAKFYSAFHSFVVIFAEGQWTEKYER